MTHRADAIDVRPVTEAEFPDWLRAVNAGFLREPVAAEPELTNRRAQFEPGRYLGAFDAGRCVATFRSFDQQVTAVGGAHVPADAVTGVTVTATHRRRGLLTRMMSQDLAAAKERGSVVATLIAAEYPIYGRFGFGPATWMTEWAIDVPRTGLDPRRSGQDEGGGRIDLVDGEDVRKLGPELHERVRGAQPGAVSRSDLWWRLNTGAVRFEPTWTEPFYALYRSPDGETEGLAAYTVDDHWPDKRPRNTLSVKWLLAATPAAERALWRYLCSIDWVTTVKSGWRAPDDLLPFLLPDPRSARVTAHADWLWVRILDVVRALEARTYGGEGALVLEVTDPWGLAGGRFRLEASPQGGSCVPTTRSADLSLPAAELARLWLGDESAVRLAALGSVREERAGAARSADALLRTPRRPWCPDMF
ncbi:GNAT family N-acetyltransferase [Streptomyces sp. NPDC017936]|uniref:GNAT family N-acetyltransferase n=1 Tax=Streptomyces sp. NPDC017936 TaxID=3365016 RepID=UPI003788FEB0